MREVSSPQDRQTDRVENQDGSPYLEKNVEPEEIHYPGATLGLVMGSYPVVLILLVLVGVLAVAFTPYWRSGPLPPPSNPISVPDLQNSQDSQYPHDPRDSQDRVPSSNNARSIESTGNPR